VGRRGRECEAGAGPSAREVAGKVLALPVMALLALLTWWFHSWPRWVPSLARLIGSREFRPVQAASADWVERSFELIERGAPWLERAGRWVCDRCFTSLLPVHGMTWFQFPRDSPVVSCSREITTVYGFDGSLPGRLAELAGALAAAGWGEYGHGGWAGLRVLSGRPADHYPPEPPVWPFEWQPVPELGVPAALERENIHSHAPGRGSLDMGFGWTSRGRQAELLTTRATGAPGDRGLPGDTDRIRRLGWPDDLRTANAIYQPVEISGTGIDQLTGQALALHEHAVAIRIKIRYYPNVNTRHRHLHKRLLPVRSLSVGP
jgi:hypothetical protein